MALQGVDLGGYQLTDKRLGSGMFAVVHLGYNTETGEKVAIKEIDLLRATRASRGGEKSGEATERVKSEVKLMREMQHPNIVRCYDFKSVPRRQSIFLVMEFCDMDLDKFLKGKKNRRIPEADCHTLMLDFVAGLQYLREMDIVHRDLKPQNILLQASRDPERQLPVLKIADFGFARLLPFDDVTATQCGTPLYMAPEIFRYRKYGIKADLWSVGCIMYQMLFGTTPIQATSSIEIHQKVMSDSLHVRFPTSIPVSVDCRHLLQGLLQADPDRRLSWEGLFAHPWLAQGGRSSSPFDSIEDGIEVIDASPQPSRHSPPRAEAIPTHSRTATAPVAIGGGRKAAGETQAASGSPSSWTGSPSPSASLLSSSLSARKPLVSPFKEQAASGGHSPLSKSPLERNEEPFVYLADKAAWNSLMESTAQVDSSALVSVGERTFQSQNSGVGAWQIRLSSCTEIVRLAREMRDLGNDAEALAVLIEGMAELKRAWTEVQARSHYHLSVEDEAAVVSVADGLKAAFLEAVKDLDDLTMRCQRPKGNAMEHIYAAAWKAARAAAVNEYFRSTRASEKGYITALGLLGHMRLHATSEADCQSLDKDIERIRVRLRHVQLAS
eukprot:CAMPEP_0114631542 /NCGR_PEP_ID=MMETSP0168-20121206/14466_1 /TAXON_ID=95228 ORGANISM="Vannella sp., Strain DIVA3 517/6/12" /NCGR_SAMPLE_ID=MMETSP0168 /ASSEMBLY_ACC=CAM_ASM_000044 /LENGTH=610 /DNA_ID=CAMNT_0001843111 /DNA_START=367 /DNA_END=2199 /DNA_ORIENTATION=-